MTPPKLRHQSQTERDMAGIAAKREREAAPMVEIEPEITGNYEGEQLAEMRATRRPDDRIGRLETKYDELAANVTEWRVEMTDEMGGVKAAVGELAGEVRGLAIVIKDAASRSHVTFTAKVDVEKAQALDTIDEKKAKRELRAKLVGAAVGGGGAITALLHLLKVL